MSKNIYSPEHPYGNEESTGIKPLTPKERLELVRKGQDYGNTPCLEKEELAYDEFIEKAKQVTEHTKE